MSCHLFKLRMSCVSERTYSSAVAVVIAAQPDITPDMVASASGRAALVFAQVLKEHHATVVLGGINDILAHAVPTQARSTSRNEAAYLRAGVPAW